RAHPHALLLASAARGRLTHRRGGVATGALSSLALALLDEALYVLLEQASAGSGGLYVVGGEPVLVEQALRRRHHAGGTLWLRRRLGDRRSGVGRGCGGRGRGAASGARSGNGGRGGPRRRLRSLRRRSLLRLLGRGRGSAARGHASLRLVDARDHVTDTNGVTLRGELLREDAGHRGRHPEGRLVRLDLPERLVGRS